MFHLAQHSEKEIKTIVQLCDKKGNLNPEAIGFARKPIFDCNLKGRFLRKKKWNYWCVFGDEILFSVTISHLDYAAVCFVYFLEYETQRFFEKTVTIPLSAKLTMPSKVLESVSFSNNELEIQALFNNNKTLIHVDCDQFDNDSLHAQLVIDHDDNNDSLNVVIPWNRYLYQFTAKHHCLPTEGFVQIGHKKYVFSREENFAVLDYGRGVWPRKAIWNWGMASQRQGQRVIGLNFGGKWTDGTGLTENAIFINGKMTKIHEDVLFHYDRGNFMKTWKIKTKFTDDVSLTFHPFFERVAKSDMKVIKSEVHQMVGYYDGKVKLQDGTILHIQKMLGCIEEHVALW